MDYYYYVGVSYRALRNSRGCGFTGPCDVLLVRRCMCEQLLVGYPHFKI